MGSSHQSERPLFPLQEMIIAVLAPFAGLFSSVVWDHAQGLVIGALLCQDPRPVAAARRVMGVGQEPRFERDHRVLNRARWSGWQAAKLLVSLVMQLLPAPWMPVWVVDDPVERRRGKRIKAKGCYRDAVQSMGTHGVKCVGLKWLSLRGWVRLPWCSRRWALPVLTVRAPSERANQQAKNGYRCQRKNAGTPEESASMERSTRRNAVLNPWPQ